MTVEKQPKSLTIHQKQQVVVMLPYTLTKYGRIEINNHCQQRRGCEVDRDWGGGVRGVLRGGGGWGVGGYVCGIINHCWE